MLTVSQLNKWFAVNGQVRPVLQDISFQAADGEFICILGPSGSGKTTLLRCIGGFDSFSGGKIMVDGQAVTAPGTDRMMIFQGFDQLFAWKTVTENLEYPLKIRGVGKPMRRELADRFLGMVGLGDFRHYYPHQLSGGMKQRAAIARALMLEPRILLMDEPFGSLDAMTRNSLQNQLLSIWSNLATTILFVTHDIEEAILLSDRILILSPVGELRNILPNHLPRPRRLGETGFAQLWDLLYSQLGDNSARDR